MAQLGICFNEKVVNWLEWPCFSPNQDPQLYPFPLAEKILKEPVHLEKGEIVVPDSPGLGIEVNEDVIAQYPWKPGPMSVLKLDG
jgi:L-alanine-DL-glutamate epimerase-like enolase superfamily enzyme